MRDMLEFTFLYNREICSIGKPREQRIDHSSAKKAGRYARDDNGLS